MQTERYHRLLAEYDSLVSYSRAISDSLIGRKIESKIASYAEALFTKLICHAVSLRKLSPSLTEDKTSELWDLSSASTVARSLIETYDALSYIGAHKADAAEREFRLILWDLHDQKRRLAMLLKIGSEDPRVDGIRHRTLDVSATLIAHPFYRTTSKKFQVDVSKGNVPPFHLSQEERNQASGIDHDYYSTATIFLSQYVHSFPFSLHQLMNFRAGQEDAIRLSSMPLQYSMPFLAKATSDMLTICPEATAVSNPKVDRILSTWHEVATNGLRGSNR